MFIIIAGLCCFKSWLDQTEPGFDDTKGLLEVIIKWLAEHSMINRFELID
jgi:hypothetical protein